VQQTKHYFHCTTLRVDSRTNQMPHLDQSLQIPVKDETATETTPHHDPFHLTTTAILKLRRSGLLPKLPSITIDEINDKNKSDAFTRAISVIQIARISIQVIAQTARRLAISQLEIAVLAFSACKFITYALNWKKPKGVSVPYSLLSFPGNIPSKVVRGIEPKVFDAYLLSLFDYEGPPETHGRRVPNDSSAEQEDLHNEYYVFGLLLKPRSLEAFML
jgi:hypothetical protein